MAIPIVWAPIIQKGLEAFAAGLGQRLGERIGDAAGKSIADAIFGTTSAADAQWHAEIDLRLSRIEQKLDTIVEFMQSKLPALIYSQVTEAILAQKVNDIKGARLVVSLCIAAYRENPNESNTKALRDASDRIIELGYSLAQAGPAWYAGVQIALVGAISGYLRLLSEDQSLKPAITTYARQFEEVFDVWLDANQSRSIAEVLATKQSELSVAKSIIQQQPLGNFLLAVHSGPIKFGEPGYMGFSDPTWVPKLETYWGKKAWIDPRGANGMWHGDWGENWPCNLNEGSVMDPQAFVSNVGQAGWKALDFVKTPIRSNGDVTTNSSMGDHFNSIVQQINDAQLKYDILPERIAELVIAKEVTENLAKACSLLKALPD